MPFPAPAVWSRDTADINRENQKRQFSPCSYFYSHARSLCLAADYFSDARLTPKSRGGVATKHRHKNQLAIFGQLMAAFEYMLKDFVAKAIDATSVFDEKVRKQEWLSISTERILAQRVVQASIGAVLVHPSLGWHSPDVVNKRFKELFNVFPLGAAEMRDLEVLWVIRHSVAHNAGLVTAPDAARINRPELSERVVHIDSEFLWETFTFLTAIAQKLASDCGKGVLAQWHATMESAGMDFDRDRTQYEKIKHLGTCVLSRAKGLQRVTAKMYEADWPH